VRTHESVAPVVDEPVVLKHHPNASLDTDREDRRDRAGIEELIVIGAMSYMSVEATSPAASDLGYGVTLAHDACATMDLSFEGVIAAAAQVHVTAMAALEFAYATLRPTADPRRPTRPCGPARTIYGLLPGRKPPLGWWIIRLRQSIRPRGEVLRYSGPRWRNPRLSFLIKKPASSSHCVTQDHDRPVPVSAIRSDACNRWLVVW